MNLYCCMITLKDDAKALSFAKATEDWMGHLQSAGTISGWRLMRRKLNLAADCYRDFLLEIEVSGLAQLEQAFQLTGTHDEDVSRLHRAMHDLIAASDIALYRPYPDSERAERMALL